MGDVLDRFSEATQAWFRSSFHAPTEAQAGAWDAISSGHHCLVVAPTGSGKTLSAFLWAIDRMAREPLPEDRLARCRVLYISPMKALAVDVERNLRAPLVGIGHAATRLGLPVPDIAVSVRSGDTPATERRAFARTPSDILITTPESLFLMLTSSVREALRGVQTVIIDEVHAVAGTKRGAHLALSLERLDALLPQPAQRVGLSATVRPVEDVARFLAGGRPTEIVQPESTKEWDLRVVVPVPDMAELGSSVAELEPGLPDFSGSATGTPPRASIWPHVEERIVDLIAEHRSTLVFANSRRLAERLTARLNEIWEERQQEGGGLPDERAGERSDTPFRYAAEPAGADGGLPAVRAERHTREPAKPPAQVMAQSGASQGAPGVLARAHHGSVSKEQRAAIEEDLKAGRLPAVVATSSLELGIDMGAVDLVIQVESPPSVASGLQRVGRAGHQVGAVSRGVLFPKFRGDLVQTAVVVERMRSGGIEALHVPANPIDVLAQQIVAMCALDEWTVDEIEALVRRSASFAGLARSVLEATLDMLAGKYPSDEFAELRPRIVWDRVTNTVTGRRGAQRLAVTSGGTIPDRGLYAVFLASGEGPGRRVGELDEEMVYESRVGDVFTLGTSSWRIEDITHDRVLVTPAPGQPGRLPFWKGDAAGRPAELGRAVGEFVRGIVGLKPEAARDRIEQAGLDEWASDNLLAYVSEQREATRHVPDDRTIVVERFRDEIGDWRVAVLSPFGSQVHAPWALCVAARMRERFGVDVQAMHGDDGIVFRLPDLEFDEDGFSEVGGAEGDAAGAAVRRRSGTAIGQQLVELVTLDPEEVRELVTAEIGGSALFAARFRECAARALLLPRRRPDRRQPLWQQRQRAAQLLQVASQYPSFPIVLETVRECLQDVFDVPSLVALMGDIRSRAVTVVDVESAQPSPFAKSLVFGYVAQYLYEGDSPLAERRAAALALDPSLLSELLGQGEALALRDLLDPQAVARTEAELQRLTPERAARDDEDLADLLRVLGPLSMTDILARAAEGFSPAAVEAALRHLEDARRVIAVRVAGDDRWAAIEDAARLRDALGTALPVGIPQAFLEPVPDPLGDLVARFARTHGPFTPGTAARWWGVGPAVVHDALRRLVSAGRVVEGELLPVENGGGRGPEFCDAEVLRLLRRRSLAALRHEVEPVTQRDLARFLPQWQGVGGGLRGREGLLRAVEQLTGAVLPASALETLVLPARVAGYRPGLLDEVMSTGEVTWRGHGSLPGDDGWVSLHLTETAHLTLAPPEDRELTGTERAVLAELAGGGAWFFRALASRLDLDDSELLDALWSLVWSGHVTGDTLAPLRALLAGGRTAHKRASSGPRTTRYAAQRRSLGRFGSLRAGLGGAAAGPGAGAGLDQAKVVAAEETARAASLRAGRAAAGSVPSTGVGRWTALPPAEADPTVRAVTSAELLLDRYGVLTRGAVVAEEVPGGFAAVYRVLAAAEEAGKVRRGYFVESLGASQFAAPGAVDRLRSLARLPDDSAGPGSGRSPEPADPWTLPAPGTELSGIRKPVGPALVLAAHDPANPYGAALPWPERRVTDPTDDGEGSRRKGHQPARKAGALVVLVDGTLVLYVERGGRTMLCWSDDPAELQAAADALALSVREGALGRLTVEKADGASVLGSGHPLVQALSQAGFHMTPRGLRLRR
ncbi:DEAD/DEAH box helicase [Intrasporangium chromatireducens Q5-1]|uniref:DEAD/DEAH box helicase n=1 Tax=Intrasporangium chromatireducens Q5-1 TaxID=584657 RepID=W9GHS4_9MICO|nr:DEAD/DEAH box helicase [Intrasporangium chromatireducens]EWT05781.1 DEAD/DEAH box helicase [Intrasporangium chromatireducens Q5-1]